MSALRRRSASARSSAGLHCPSWRPIAAAVAAPVSRSARRRPSPYHPAAWRQQMAEESGRRFHHISSAVVSALPARVDAVLASIRELPETEVHRVENGKIVIVLEGSSTGAIGDRL